MLFIFVFGDDTFLCLHVVQVCVSEATLGCQLGLVHLNVLCKKGVGIPVYLLSGNFNGGGRPSEKATESG